MKSFRFVTLTLIFFSAPLVAFAARSGDFAYELINGGTEVEITHYYPNSTTGRVEIPAEIESKPVTSIATFSFWEGLTEISIPDSVTHIGDYAFFICSNLTSIRLSNSVISIGKEAFNGCDSLTNVTIPESVISIGHAAFAACDGLMSINIDSGNTQYSSVGGVLFTADQNSLLAYPGGINGAYIIPDNVTSIGRAGFFGCAGLTGVTIHDDVTSIGDNAFIFCDRLASINVDSENTHYSSVGGVLFTADQNSLLAYPGGINGTYIIPDSVTSIGYAAFRLCNGLTNVTIGNSVTSIGDYAFHKCDSLASVAVGNRVISIGDHGFGSCESLTSVYFMGDAPTYGDSVFDRSDSATVYYRPGTVGWGTTYAGRPVVLWDEMTHDVLGELTLEAENLYGHQVYGMISFGNEGADLWTAWSYGLQSWMEIDPDGTVFSREYGELVEGGDPLWALSSCFGWTHFGVDADQYGGWVWTERFSWMKFEWVGEDVYLWVPMMNTWMAVNGDGSFQSFQWGLLSPEGLTRYQSSIFGGLTTGDFGGWVHSDRFGWMWANGDGTWYWSETRKEWLGVTAEGGIWSTAEGRFL